MKAGIITIGDEILIGQITDTNSGYIAAALDKIGIQVVEMISVGDEREQILSTLTNYQNQFDFIFITGGLGPTKDDITKKSLCEFFEDILVRDHITETHIRSLFQKLNYAVEQVNLDQSLVPSKAQVLLNRFGTAPGMWMKKEDTVFISMPGVPYEMKGIIDFEVIPKLVREFKRPYIIHKTILTYGMGESKVAARIEKWEDQLPTFIKLAYLPSPGRVRLRLTARGTDELLLKQSIDEHVEKLLPLIDDIVTGFDEGDTIEVTVGKLLKERNLTLSTAESCTGGKIASTISSVSGASSYFKGSMICYATELKTTLLGISPELIDQYSVVSQQVAESMAQGAQKVMTSDFAIATTGNAGPTKGDSDAEIGDVCIAIATPNGTVSERFNFGQPRSKVIVRAVNKGLEMLQKEILKNY
ncbi:MAG: CinA family nicotinamide mononucleotide deamidase-related protein [Flavobacterium sp.]